MDAEKPDAGKALLEQFDIPVDPASNPQYDPEPAAEPAAEAVEPAVETPKPKHPSWLVNEAAKLGIENADAMDSAELKDAVSIISRTRAAEQSVRQRDPETGQFVKAKDPETPKEFSLKDAGINSEAWDADTPATKIAADIAQPLMKIIGELKSELSALKERDETRERNAQFDKLDQLFATNETVFGKGARHSLKAGSDEILRRQVVISAMGTLKQQNPGLSLDDAFRKVSETLFGRPAQEPAPTRLDKTEPFANGHTIKPTVRATKAPPKGDAAATAAVEQLLKERAVSAEPTEHDELPEL